MIAVDASVLVAILLLESDHMTFRRFMAGEDDLVLSPVGYWEAATRLRSVRGDDGVADLDRVLARFGIKIAPANEQTATLAADAEKTFGKRTAAKLNMGDCFAYALAKELDAPLLYKGNDFRQTDVMPALPA